MTQPKKRAAQERHERNKLSLFPLSVEKALSGAMATGKPPQPENKRAKRTATKRRRSKKSSGG